MDNNNYKNIYKIFALLSFLLAFGTYALTVQDSVPFWDTGEFSAAAIWQQVPHPPGAPLFLMIGKMFDILIPFGDPGWKLNMVSVVSSAFVVLMLYIISTKVIRNFSGNHPDSLAAALANYGSSFLGAAAFTFSDTFWFNAVESEVYAMSMVFVAIMIYLAMKWNEEAENPGNEKYLLLLAYLVGLSTGVHLLAVLTIPAIAMIVYYRKFKFSIIGLVIAIFVGGFVLNLAYPVIVKWVPALLAGHSIGRDAAGEYPTENSIFLTALPLIVILASAGLLVASKYIDLKSKKILSLMSASFLLIILGYTTYTQILIRANVAPPMNENRPIDFAELSKYISREQYGNDASWPRRVKDEERFTRIYKQKNSRGEYVYGEWFPPERREVRTASGKRGTEMYFPKINTMGELSYLWGYQMNHMFFRYLFWNYSGKTSDMQDADWVGLGTSKATQDEIINLNYKSGYADKFPIMFFSIPIILGLLGMFFHFKQDWKMGSVFMMLFLFLGVLAAIAQQQQDPQPRERDYFYAGAFMIYALWIGLGAYYFIVSLTKKIKKNEDESDTNPLVPKFAMPTVAGILIVSFLAVPVNMAMGGWFIHNRTGDYLPFDYSYNMLQSAEENAIIFTNGDNDTFPVWYIQDVMGVRRDVRIVNLSLGNTTWYVYQLKNNKPWGAEKIPLSFSNDSLEVDEYNDKAISYDFGEQRILNIPVKRDILSQYTSDENILNRGRFITPVNGRNMGQGRNNKPILFYRVQDKLIIDILQQVKFERPIYFSTTVGSDAFIGLDKFFRYEGLLMRVCPVEQPRSISEAINIDFMDKCLMNIDNSDDFSKEFKTGFKLRNLSNPDVYYDPVDRRLMSSYRELYTNLASAYFKIGNAKRAKEVLNAMNEYISVDIFPLQYQDLYEMANNYKDWGDNEMADKYYDMAIESLDEILGTEKLLKDWKYYEATDMVLGPHRLASRIHEERGDYMKAIAAYKTFKNYLLTLEPQMQGSNDMKLVQTFQINLLETDIRMMTLEIDRLVSEDKFQEARDLTDSYLQQYDSREDQAGQLIRNEIYRKYIELEREAFQRDNPQEELENQQ